MKRILSFALLLFILSCNQDWNNPLETDIDLKQTPQIVRIQLNEDNNIEIYLNYSYSQEANIFLERKNKGAFEQHIFKKISQSTIVDTIFDRESDFNFTYRFYIEKNYYKTDYSNEKSFEYNNSKLFFPSNFSLSSKELQGVQISWKDNSNKESGYLIEKNSGSGYQKLIELNSNIETYLDVISGVQDPALSLSYRVRAYNSTLNSDWQEGSISHSGLGSPTNLQVVDNSFYNFQIQWQDNSLIESNYLVERKKDSGAFQVIATLNPNSTQYIDKISEIGNYSYRVRVKKDANFSAYSNVVSENITQLLEAPTDLQITDNTPHNFTIKWSDNSSIETGYIIQRKKDSSVFTQLDEVLANTTTYTDAISEVGEYSYRVQTRMNSYYSDFSNTVTENITSVLPMEGLVAYYPFNGNANDESVNGHHGTVNGATLTSDRKGNSNSAYDFDGIDDYVEMQFNPIGDIVGGNYSFNLWFNPDDATNSQFFLELGEDITGINDEFTNLSINDHKLRGQAFFGNWSEIILLDGEVNNSVWQMATFVREQNDWKIYLNGILVGSGSHSGVFSNEYFNKKMVVGATTHTPPGLYFGGMIDELGIWNRNLSETEISNLYNE